VEVVTLVAKKAKFPLSKSVISWVIVTAFCSMSAFADDSSSNGGTDFFSFLRKSFSSLSSSSGPNSGAGAEVVSASPNPVVSPAAESGTAEATSGALSDDSTGVPPNPYYLDAHPATVANDSSIQVSGQGPAGVRWLMVQLRKDGVTPDPEPQTIAWSAGAPLPKVYLYEGPGKYRVDFYYSTSQLTGDFQFLTGVDAVNQDQRDGDLLPSVSVQSDAPEIIDLAKRITASVRDPLEKSRAIHDWVAKNINYDGAESDLRVSKNKSGASQDALTVLRTRNAICEGYANLTAALHRAIGIRAKVIAGYFKYVSPLHADIYYRGLLTLDPKKGGVYHAWNKVEIRNRWINVDTTEDSVTYDVVQGWMKQDPISRTFFNSDPKYFDLTHSQTEVFW
jgi:transglutaminase-like putative cysteine protease